MVAEVVAELPPPFLEALGEVQIVAAAAPSAAWLAARDLPEDEELFGFYEGVPLTEAGSDDLPSFRGTITIFRDPHLAVTHGRHALREEVRRTVIHEIAHHFGFDEDAVDELGFA